VTQVGISLGKHFYFTQANLLRIVVNSKLSVMAGKKMTVAWISDFPVEWLTTVPGPLQHLPRRHPATWQIVLMQEFQRHPELQLHILLFRGNIPGDFRFEQDGVTFHVLRASPKLRLASFFWLDTVRIRKACRQIQPDVIHAWGSEKGASLIASRLPYPYVMTIQGLFAWYKLRMKLPKYDRFVEFVERRSLRRAKVVTTESNFAVRFLSENFPGPQVHQAEHAPNQAFHRIARRPATAPVEFLVVGGLGHRKGTDLLFAALEQLRPELDFRLKIISDPAPQYLATLRASVSAATWERVEFKHHLLPHEVARELETPTLLLMPTRADTSPNAVKEAVVAGLPVVAAEVGGIPDYVVHNQNGLLFPAGDLAAFVAAIRTACAHPRFGRGQVDPDTLARERDYLSPALMARKFLAAYESAIALGRR
jgi:glycosyltransferase involved in cell wall biosynthesis